MSRNDITGDDIKSKMSTEKYGTGWEGIWGKKKAEPTPCNCGAPASECWSQDKGRGCARGIVQGPVK